MSIYVSRKQRRVTGLFFLFIILNQVLLPEIAYALTAGPTAPEATNFEPVDTTDMVNPFTGSFTYNLPLLEVPGPEGGYPLALSYHAGIQPNEEASWVGLGWSLNPGAIARNVNGFPDDWKGIGGTERDYWAGGTTTTETIGVNIGLTGSPASVSFDLSFSQDTYRGFGVGESFGIGGPYGSSFNLNLGPYGNEYASIGLSRSAGDFAGLPIKATGSLSLSTNFHTLSVHGSLKASLILSDGSTGASLNSSGVSVNGLNGLGASTTVSNSKAGKIMSHKSGFAALISITPGVAISLGYTKIRYHSDETTGFTGNGVIYSRTSISAASDLNLSGDDNYLLLNPNSDIVDNPDPVEQLGGTYPNFDNYSVTAQGLGGSMRPYIFSTVLYNQNRQITNNQNINSYGITHSISGTTRSQWQFRFINDLSNSYRQQSSDGASMDYVFDQSPIYGKNDGDVGYDENTNRLEGSNHIEYFTNDEIADPSLTSKAHLMGFVTCPEEGGFVRQTTANGHPNLGAQIGGFMITNSSGVTYHYALPAYSGNELVHTEAISTSLNYNALKKAIRYAYTWYLTAITGPDYVSRGATPGLLDPSDWGYWVKFDYGQWTATYGWRNPSEGFHRDNDNSFQAFSMGQKELYYLDAIVTRSHTAIFSKEIRNDGRSNTGDPNNVESPGVYVTQPVSCSSQGNTPKSTLRLDNIYIFKNEDLPTDINTIRQSSTNYVQNQAYDSSDQSCDVPEAISEGQNVIDINDINALEVSSGWTSKCLRKIAFNYDYSLSPGVTNSYDPTTLISTGKLTLLSVDFQGKGGTPMTPPIQFQYDLDPTDPKNNGFVSTTYPSGITGTVQFSAATAANFSIGDIITFNSQGTTYFCVLKSTTDNINYNVVYRGTPPPAAISYINVVKTKNPPYNNNSIDNWGFYKSDYIPSPTGNENLCRFTTQASNFGSDVWSLRKIISSIGSNISISYEGNTYNKSVLNKNRSLIVTGLNKVGTNTYSITLNNENTDLTSVYKYGDKVTVLLGKYVYCENPEDYAWNAFTTITSDSYPTAAVIQSVGSNSLVVKVDPKMDFDITNTAGFSYYDTGGNTGTTPSPGNGWDAIICEGNVSANGDNLFYGAGIRVKDILVDDLNGNVKGTSYSYKMPNTPPGQISSSGVTTYEPLIFDQFGSNVNGQSFTFYNKLEFTSQYYQPYYVYRRALYKDFNNLLAIANELPSPGVEYEYVTVSDFNLLSDDITRIPVNGTTTYQYEVFKPEMIGYETYYSSPPTTYNPGIPGQTINNNSTTIVSSNKRDISIVDFTSRIGNLKRIVTYDVNGNKLTEKVNHYLYDGLENTAVNNELNFYPGLLTHFNSIGVIQERYANARYLAVDYDNHTYNSVIMMSDKETYPSLETGSTQIDYKNGTTMSQTNLGFDFYSGAVTEMLIQDSYGNRFLHQTTPAYALTNGASSVYPTMGLKTHDDDPGATQHAQMLTQEGSDYTFTVDANNTPIGVVSAAVQTWGNDMTITDPYGNQVSQPSVWRKESNYVWRNTGTAINNLTPYSSFVDYFYPNAVIKNINSIPNSPGIGGVIAAPRLAVNNNNSNTGGTWQQINSVTQYNVYSAALEGLDVNANFSAVRMGYNNSKVIINGSSAAYNEIAYAGVEDRLLTSGVFSSQVSIGDATVITDSTKAHTGLNSLMATSGQRAFIYNVKTGLLNTGKNFSAAVWVYGSSSNITQTNLYYQIDGGAIVIPKQSYSKSAAGWYLLEMTIPATSLSSSKSTLTVGCVNSSPGTVYFDDFRFQPSSATVSAYVYDNNTDELTYIIGNNNLYTRYQYDAIGRLVRVYHEVLGKQNIPLIKGIAYNYGRTGAPNWQNLGGVRCQVIDGYNTGYQEFQQADINPLSPSYNATRWLRGSNPYACALVIYMKLTSVQNPLSAGEGLQGNYTFSFFSDPAGTIPLTLLSNLNVTLHVQQTGYSAPNNVNPFTNAYDNVFTVPGGSTSFTTSYFPLYECQTGRLNPFTTDSSGSYCVTNTFSVGAGGYTLIN